VNRLVDYVPGPRRAQRTIFPALDMPRKLTSAWIGEGLAQAEVKVAFTRARVRQMDALDSVFGKGATAKRDFRPAGITFTGTAEQAKNPNVGTLADIVVRPGLYSLSEPQRAVIGSVHEARSQGFELIKQRWGLDIDQFPVQPGGLHLPNVDVSEKALKVTGSVENALRRGRTKERFYATAADRWAHDPTFKPETNISALLQANDDALASMAGRNTFLQGSGGLTRLEAMQETHPALVETMNGLKKRLSTLKSGLDRLDQKQAQAVDDFLKSPLEDIDLTELQAGMNPIIKRPVFRTPEGEFRVMPPGPNFGKDMEALRPEIQKVKQAIDELRPGWRTANLNPYTLVQEGVYRYFPAEEAEHVRRLVGVSNNPILRFVDNLRATAFGGDLSPVSIQGQIAWASDPIGGARFLAKGHGTLTQKGLLNLMDKDPVGWERFVRASGLDPLGVTTGGFASQEFATGFPAKLPKVGKAWENFNEALYRPLVSMQKDIFESSYQAGRRLGLTEEQAMAIAADDATKIIPRSNFRRFGQSQVEAARYRAVLTSVSFLTQPVSLVNDATKGLVKLGLLQPISPSETFAIRRVATLAATISAISVLSNVYHARSHDLDVEQAIKDSLDPTSGKFMSLVLPGGFKIGLGGPFRSMIKAVVPQDVPGVPVPMPFAGLAQFGRGKLGPAPGTALDELQNKDFFDRQIRTGNFPLNVLQGMEYALEGTLPLTAGTALEQARKGASARQIGEQTASQFMGTNMTPQSLRDIQDAVSWEHFGEHFGGLTPAQEGTVNEDARVKAKKADRAREAGPGSPRQRAFVLQQKEEKNQLADDALFNKNEMDSTQWRENRAARRADLSSRLDEIYANQKFPEKDRGILDDYQQELTEAKARHNGILTADAWDEVDRWVDALPLQDQVFIAENTGVGPATPLEKEYRAANKALSAASYWDYYKKHPTLKADPALLAQYEQWLRSGRTDAGGDVEEMQFWDKVLDGSRKNLLKGNPQLDIAVAKFYGGKPQSIEGKREMAKGADPLQVLEGIGPTNGEKLRKRGITTLAGFVRKPSLVLGDILGESAKTIERMKAEARAVLGGQ